MTIQDFAELETGETGDCELLQIFEDTFRARILDLIYSEPGMRTPTSNEIADAFYFSLNSAEK